MIRQAPQSSDTRAGVQIILILAAVTALWGGVLLLVSPTGDFPLNDDWIYGQAVKDWIETGHYAGHPFATANLVGQAWWGKLFCLSFGFSFTALRWSTLVLWLVAAWAVALTALTLRARPLSALLAGALTVANPLAMNLGYTFMTDVPFMAVMALACFCYVRALADPGWTWLFAGSLFGAWGLLIRQFAILLPVALVLAFLPLAFRLGRRECIRLFIPLALPWILAWGLLQFLPSHAAELGHTWDPRVLGRTTMERALGGLKFYGIALVYLALFALPLIIGPWWFWLRHTMGSWRRRLAGFTAILVVFAALVCWSAPHRIPFLGNIIYDTGIGPMTMKGILLGNVIWRPAGIGVWWWIPTIVGLGGAAWMLAGCLRWFVLIPGDGRRPAADARRRQQCFLMFWAVLTVVALYHPWLPVRFDRYFLGALVPVLLMLAMAPSGRSRVVLLLQVAAFVAIFGYSLVGLQDYMAWNRARWSIAERLMVEEKIPPTSIDAGYEFNGWLTSPHFIEEGGARAFLYSGDLGWWAVKDTWAISWLPRPGFETVEEIPYDSWLAGEAGKLLLLKRKEK